MSDDVKITICIVIGILGFTGTIAGAIYKSGADEDAAKVECIKSGQTAEACDILFGGGRR